MTAAVALLAHQVAVRAQKDKRFAQVLDALLTAPTTPQGTLEPIAARTLTISAAPRSSRTSSMVRYGRRTYRRF
jgi:hypothetical protein